MADTGKGTGAFIQVRQDDWEELNRALRYIYEQIDGLAGRRGSIPMGSDLDLNGHKAIHAADPTEDTDVVNKEYADANYGPQAIQTELRATGSNPLIPVPLLGPGSPVVLADIYANRPAAASLGAGTLFYATDRTVTYLNVVNTSNVQVWIYKDGIMFGTLSPNQKPTLTTNDTNFLFYSSDFQHLYRWTGSAWVYADDGSGYIRNDTISPPRSGVWQLCDGTAGVSESKADGTIGLVAFSGLAAGTMPNLTATPSYARWNSAVTGTVNAAVAPTISGNTGATSGGTPAGTISTPTFTGDAAPTSVANTALGTDNAVAFPYTPTGNISTPTFSGSALSTHVHSGASLVVSATTGMRNMDVFPFYRL